MYILHYAEKNDIMLPNKDTLFRMIDNVHDVTGRIKQFHKEINTKSDDRIQPDKDH